MSYWGYAIRHPWIALQDLIFTWVWHGVLRREQCPWCRAEETNRG